MYYVYTLADASIEVVLWAQCNGVYKNPHDKRWVKSANPNPTSSDIKHEVNSDTWLAKIIIPLFHILSRYNHKHEYISLEINVKNQQE